MQIVYFFHFFYLFFPNIAKEKSTCYNFETKILSHYFFWALFIYIYFKIVNNCKCTSPAIFLSDSLGTQEDAVRRWKLEIEAIRTFVAGQTSLQSIKKFICLKIII
jgi:hypothetical protein